MLKINNDEIKIIISDFDGTLRADKNKAINYEDVEEIKKAMSDGARFVINTGNVPFEMIETVEMIAPISEDNKYIICCNGNAIKNYYTNQVKVETFFDNKTTKKIIDKIKLMDLDYDITSFDLDKIYYSNLEIMNQMIAMGLSKFDKLNRLPVSDEIVNEIQKCPKITLKNIKPEDKENLIKIIENDFHDIELYATWFTSDGVDLGIAGPNKFQGIISLLEIINKENGSDIKLDNIIYFGDQHNDLEVFKNLKYAIAVGNATEEIKKLAYDITDTAENSGVAKYLQKISQ
ncbi:Cof-like hydrolase [Spiroplasma sabaudiense Ar-1343]|uniref:Cof-like hydrolase n=1 Tax=Spiroplasma sabaudiense Ar-1343 TaxID=1276257 RepID=W6AJ64_9MOLU|nr:HAD hydrolase family protein [Spiroplasma sabaudiense]AHI53754.1 Cof-like hydrolase [Spiroplasma sabaudiense Ar-1343]